MLKKLMCLTIVCLLSGSMHYGFAAVLSIDPIPGTPSPAAKTKTFLWEAKNPKATLVFIPGGDGRLNLADDKENLGGFYGNTLRPLSDLDLTSGSMNVVVFDGAGTGTRTSDEHMMRIESVILYYKEKYNKPVWLMGHSNGAISITSFLKYLQKNKKESLLAGMVYSSGRNGSNFSSETTDLPVLFLAHDKDGCPSSTVANSKSVYEGLKHVDKAKVEYVFIQGGSAEADACHAGFHMFNGASEEAYKAIDAFIAPYYK